MMIIVVVWWWWWCGFGGGGGGVAVMVMDHHTSERSAGFRGLHLRDDVGEREEGAGEGDEEEDLHVRRDLRRLVQRGRGFAEEVEVAEAEIEDDQELDEGDQADQRREEKTHPADCLAVDDVKGVLGNVELDVRQHWRTLQQLHPWGIH